MGWFCVAVGWVLFAEGGVICFTAPHAWPFWGAAYVLACVFWLVLPRLIWRAARS
jgi:hypothetical protein